MSDVSSIIAGKAVISISSNPMELINGILTSSGLLKKLFEEHQNKEVILDAKGYPLKRVVEKAKFDFDMLTSCIERLKKKTGEFGALCENNLKKTFGNLKVHGLALLAIACPFTATVFGNSASTLFISTYAIFTIFIKLLKMTFVQPAEKCCVWSCTRAENRSIRTYAFAPFAGF